VLPREANVRADIRIERLSDLRREDFYRLHETAKRPGWCNCVAWWTRDWDGWSDRTTEENRALRDGLFARERSDGYLLYADGDPAGWCQALERDRLAKLARQFALEPDPHAWAIGCIYVAPHLRRHGLATRLVAHVIAEARRDNVRSLEAFPKRGDQLDELDLWNGPEALFLRLGFKLVRDDPKRPVLALDLVGGS
jgi:GNAT superfamily N-acetyltransferase